jgi:hypothetical protein
VARKLNSKQKKIIEEIAETERIFLTQEEMKKIEDINFYETTWSDANRYLLDLVTARRFGPNKVRK